MFNKKYDVNEIGVEETAYIKRSLYNEYAYELNK